MISFHGFSILSHLFVICIFLHVLKFDCVSSSSSDSSAIITNQELVTADDVISSLHKECNKSATEQFPEIFCSTIYKFALLRAREKCDHFGKKICEDYEIVQKPQSFIVNDVIGENTCPKTIENVVCTPDIAVFDAAKERCIPEMKNLMLTLNSEDKNGKQEDICRHLPTIAGSYCEGFLDNMCEKLPTLSAVYDFFCEDNIHSDVCEPLQAVVVSDVPPSDTDDSADVGVAVRTTYDVFGNLTKLCKTATNFPDVFCTEIYDIVQSSSSGKCDNIANGMCKGFTLVDLPWKIFWKDFKPAERGCSRIIRDIVCAPQTAVFYAAKRLCIEKLKDLMFVPNSGDDGGMKPKDFCDKLPNTVGGYCGIAIDSFCAKLPRIPVALYSHACEDVFAKVVCEPLDEAAKYFMEKIGKDDE